MLGSGCGFAGRNLVGGRGSTCVGWSRAWTGRTGGPWRSGPVTSRRTGCSGCCGGRTGTSKRSETTSAATCVGQVRHPAVTHQIVETVEHLSTAQPKPALRLALHAVTEDHGYITESLGVDAVIKIINRYMADHRELVLGDPECTAAVRRLLEEFVPAGWPKAEQMAERMDELFR
jgi:hypothetical protein